MKDSFHETLKFIHLAKLIKVSKNYLSEVHKNYCSGLSPLNENKSKKLKNTLPI